MKKLYFLIFVILFSTLYFSAGGITISERTPIVILPAKTSIAWRSDILDSLLTSLEEKALELGRFKVLSRVDIDRILEERKLSLAGITETQAINVGKIAGAKYAVLLHLLRFETSYDSDLNSYVSYIDLSIKVYDLETSELLFVKKIEALGYGDKSFKAETNAINFAASSIFSALRESFKQKAYVGDIKGKYVKLIGIDPTIVKKNQIFKTKGPLREGYVKVIELDQNFVMAEILYGEVRKGDVANEYPVLPVWGGVGASFGLPDIESEYSLVPFSFNFFGFSANEGFGFSTDIGMFGIFGDYTPYLLLLSGQYLFKMGRISIAPNAGAGLFAIYSETADDVVLMLPGITFGARMVYEFNPSSAITFSVNSTTLFGAGCITMAGFGFILR